MSDIVELINKTKVYDVAVETPLDYAPELSKLLKAKVYLKREDLQSIHSFKLRGAYNKIVNLTEVEKSAGIMAASAGNHAQGVALSAQKLRIRATIVMPRTTPDIKVAAVRELGADVILQSDSFTDASIFAMQLAENNGMTYIHPFDDELVIAGQGTIAKEIYEQLSTVDYVFIPIGGGGLISGIAAYLKSVNPEIKVIGVEPEDSNAMAQSIKQNKQIELDNVGIFADGVAVKKVGDLTLKLTKKYVDEIVTVTTDEISVAIKDIYSETRSIVEPAGALGVAGLKKYRFIKDLTGKNLVAINSGANMTFERLQFIAERTLVGSLREVLYAIELPEHPGALNDLVKKVINGFSITEFNYRKQSETRAQIFVGVLLELPSDKTGFERKLKNTGYKHVDLTEDEIAKSHLRHMVGGKPPVGTKEIIFEFTFPERPGALGDFLDAMNNEHNISLFHYRYTGGDIARVLIGLEGSEVDNFELPKGFSRELISSKAIELFL